MLRYSGHTTPGVMQSPVMTLTLASWIREVIPSKDLQGCTRSYEIPPACNCRSLGPWEVSLLPTGHFQVVIHNQANSKVRCNLLKDRNVRKYNLRNFALLSPESLYGLPLCKCCFHSLVMHETIFSRLQAVCLNLGVS